jgi:hypothetical protein
MLSFRNSMTFIVAAALAVAIAVLMHAHQTSNASSHNALPAGDLVGVAGKPPPEEHWFPRASTHAAEVAKTNHEGF